MLRTHNKFPDEVDRQDPDFIYEYQAVMEAERQIAAERQAQENDPIARAKKIRQDHKAKAQELTAKGSW